MPKQHEVSTMTSLKDVTLLRAENKNLKVDPFTAVLDLLFALKDTQD